MEYSILQLGKMAGISTRTLRYYDEIGILKPARINSSGYRIYGQKEVDELQQILFYRELGFELQSIGSILHSPAFDGLNALKEHRKRLLDKKEQMDLLIANVEKTIAVKEGGSAMSDQEKFIGLKKRMTEENEKKYGTEIREKYGEEVVEKSNQQFLNMSEEDYNEMTRLGEEIIGTLKQAFTSGEPGGELGQKVANLHRRWLGFTWPHYSKEAHAGLARMYVDDERFKAYYDQHQPGGAEFLRDAILIYTGMNK